MKIENATRLSSRHRRVAELALQGKSVKEIAGSVGSEPRHVAFWLSTHPIIKQLLDQAFDAEALVGLTQANQLLRRAMRVTSDLMEPGVDERLRLQAAGLACAIHRQVSAGVQQARLLRETEQLRLQLDRVTNPMGEVIDVEAALDPLLAECRALPSANP